MTKTLSKAISSALVAFAMVLMVACDSGDQSSSHEVSEKGVDKPRFEEGVHYERVESPSVSDGSAILVQEFFSYGCPHCFHMEDGLKEWKKTLANDVEFEAVPAYWNDFYQAMAHAFYTQKELSPTPEKSATLHAALFNAIHVEEREFKSLADVREIFIEHDITQDQFMKTFSSLAVQAKVKAAGEAFRQYGLTSVPSFVVNGEYRTDKVAAGSQEAMFEVIDYLIQQSREDRNAAQ